MSEEPSSEEWSWWRRWLFRFVAAYCLWTIGPFVFSYVSGFGWVIAAFEKINGPLVPWFGEKLVGKAVVYVPNGSGDQLYHWVATVHDLVIALAITVVWSIVDRRRKHYRRLQALLIIYVRYALAAVLLAYGSTKLWQGQFPEPGPDRLLKPLGEMSPMGLMWTFMGYSPLYKIFAGASEVLAGLLLMHRRTATLGALISFGVMLNVVLLNFSYDVPVKLMSTHMVLQSLLVVAPDARRLFAMFVTNRPIEPAPPGPRFKRPWIHRASRVAKWAWFVWIIVFYVKGNIEDKRLYGKWAPKPTPFGLYRVTSFSRNGVRMPAQLSDEKQWSVVGIGSYAMSVRCIDASTLHFRYEDDAPHQTMALTTRKGIAGTHVASYRVLDANHLSLTLLYSGEYLQMELERSDHTQTPLLSRGFHWVNESPFNY